MFKDNRLA
jgi:hypothetical protein